MKECAFAKTSSSSSGSSKTDKGSKGSKKAAAAAATNDSDDDGDGDYMDEDEQAPARGATTSASDSMEVALCLCVEVLSNLAVMAADVPLRSNKEVLQAALEGCMELLGCSKPLKTPAGAKNLGLRTTGTISSAAYSLLSALFAPQHSCMSTMAAVLLPRLTPLIVGTGGGGGGKRTAADIAADRTAALEFVVSAYRCDIADDVSLSLCCRLLCAVVA